MALCVTLRRKGLIYCRRHPERSRGVLPSRSHQRSLHCGRDDRGEGFLSYGCNLGAGPPVCGFGAEAAFCALAKASASAV